MRAEALVLLLTGCGGLSGEYSCHLEGLPFEVYSHQQLDCGIVKANMDRVRAIGQGLPEFEDSIKDINSMLVRDEDCWGHPRGNSSSDCYQGLTHFSPWHGPDVELGAGMESLSHELGHVWLNHYTGDSDEQHRYWVSSGQLQRDAEYRSAAKRPRT